jgi:hypothetical protein
MKHLSKAIAVAVLAGTSFSAVQAATPYMTAEQYNEAVKQQQETFRKSVEAQRAQYQEQITAHREAAEKQRAALIEQTEALRKQYTQNITQPVFAGQPVHYVPQPAFANHAAQIEQFAEAQRKQMESIAERTREAFEKQATVQKDRMDEYMLTSLPPHVKERVLKAQEDRSKRQAEMDAKRAEIEKQAEERRKAAEARIADLQKRA